MAPDKGTHALYFCDRVTYEIGPSSRQIAATDADKTWEFKFPPIKEVPKSIFVSTYRKTQNYRVETTDSAVGMTMKMANLLSVSILNTYNRKVTAGTSMVLTPLGGAIFSAASISEMMKAMGVSEKGAYEMINSSTCSGGYTLDGSDANCAIASILYTTRNLKHKDEKIRDSLVSKTVKNYAKAGKKVDREAIKGFLHYCSGGMPEGINVNDLYEDADKVLRLGAIELARARTACSVDEWARHLDKKHLAIAAGREEAAVP